MAQYTFACPECGKYECVEAPVATGPRAPVCHGPMKRNYRADGIRSNLRDLKREREGFTKELFLPTAEDYKSPGDPDGTKGLRQWDEDHSPKGHAGLTRPGGRELKASF